MGALTNICVFLLIVASISSLPIKIEVDTPHEKLSNDASHVNITKTEDVLSVTNSVTNEVNGSDNRNNISNTSGIILRNEIRPGMIVSSYAIEITPDLARGTFSGRATIQVNIIDLGTREDSIVFHARDLDIDSVTFSFAGGSTFTGADFDVDGDDGTLTIETGFAATLYSFIIEYTGSMDISGHGIFVGEHGNTNFIAMNLHPVNARRVFPCIDEPTEQSTISFAFNNMELPNIVSNSMLEENSQTNFRPLQGPVHLWGMVAHNMNTVNIPIANVLLYARPGIANQDAQASVAINFFFTNLNEWTGKEYVEIILNQDGRMHIFALPDSSRDWYALSTVCIWEPFILMEAAHSVKQRTTALTTIAESMARQWFGYVVYPENWRHQWVITGLAKYSAFEILRAFQRGNDVTLIDVNTIFVSDIVQESLLRDSYGSAQRIEPEEDIFEEDEIRDLLGGLINYKAPAIMRMARLVLGDEDQDFIQGAAKALLNSRGLQSVNTLNFFDAINSDWLFEGNEMVDDIGEFFEPYIHSTGYPLLHVGLRQGGILLTQEHFSFSSIGREAFQIPLTYTTGETANFDNIHPVMMMDRTITINVALGEEDWILFNLQGQGYYRVNYDGELWERIIDALYDPERREEIHPLNRATLVDDALNLARARKLNYDTAFPVVLAMEHETDYAVWKAFVRNMNFIRKHLIAMITEDEDLDPDIYVRMVRRTIIAFEDEIGFDPDPQVNEPAMVSLTRGLVMDHACRANHKPCIAAAVDWFYDPNNNEIVNPNIPHELRPAVYCTMVREGDEDIIEMLEERLEIEATHYERLVILESLACSQDNDFIRDYLLRTVAEDSPYGVEERLRIFKAVAEASFENANAALAFLVANTQNIRNMYGGADRLEEAIFALADNMASPGQHEQFTIFVNSVNSFLDDSVEAARRALEQVGEDMQWNTAHLEAVYEWIDENDAPTMIVSSLLIFISLCVALFNH